MYVILVNLPSKLQDYLTLKFLSLGIELYIKDNPKEIERLLEEKGSGYLFMGINQMSSPFFGFLSQLKEYKEEGYYKLIVLSGKSDRDFVQVLLLLGVVGMIPSNLEIDEIYKRFDKIIKSREPGNELREFQRITPKETDEITVNLSIPNSSMIITGKAVNVSMGGIALKLSGTGEARWLSPGQMIESAQMRINGKIGMTSMKVVAVKDTFVGVHFIKPTDYFLNLLGRYIVDRLAG